MVTQRIETLVSLGLLEEVPPGPSEGGRAPRGLRFRAEAGTLLVGELSARSLIVGICDLAGTILASEVHPADVTGGPAPLLDQVEEAWIRLLQRVKVDVHRVWALGLGVPGPVEFVTGRPVVPPMMPGWDDYPIRDRLSAKFNIPVWVDNEVNLRAVGEARDGLGRTVDSLIYLKIGTGIGAGIISNGVLHRGAQGAAGDIGHIAVVDDPSIICRCGKIGCLEAVAGGEAIGRSALARAEDPRSTSLAVLAASSGALTSKDVTAAAREGDPIALDVLVQAARIIGETAAVLVNFHNPALLVIGGTIVQESDLVLSAMRETIYRRSLPLATRSLAIERSELGKDAALRGASAMLLDELLRPDYFYEWVLRGTPQGNPQIAREA